MEGGAAAVVGGVHIWHVLDKKCQYMFAPRSCCGQMKWGFPRLLKMGEVVDEFLVQLWREGRGRERMRVGVATNHLPSHGVCAKLDEGPGSIHSRPFCSKMKRSKATPGLQEMRIKVGVEQTNTNSLGGFNKPRRAQSRQATFQTR